MMEKKNNRKDAPKVEMTQRQRDIMLDHGFAFGAKTSYRFAAGVKACVEAEHSDLIEANKAFDETIASLKDGVAMAVQGKNAAEESVKVEQAAHEETKKKLAVIESDFLKAVSEVGALKEKLAAPDRRIQRMQAHLDAQRKHFDANPNDMHAKARMEALEGMVMAADEEPKEATSEIADTCATPDPVPASPETPVSDHGNTEK